MSIEEVNLVQRDLSDFLKESVGIDFDTINLIVLVAAGVASAIALLASFSTYYHRRTRVFRAASRTFLFLMFTGSQFTWLGMAATTLLETFPYKEMCYVIFALQTMGFAVVFGCLVIKTARVVQFIRGKHGLPKITDHTLLDHLSSFLIFWCCFLAFGKLYDFFDPLDISLVTYHQEEQSLHTCQMGKIALYRFLIQSICIVYGCLITFQTRIIEAPFKERFWMSQCTRLFFIYWSIAAGIFYYTYKVNKDYSLIFYLLDMFSLYSAQLLTVVFLFVPKLFLLKHLNNSSPTANPPITVIKIDPPMPAVLPKLAKSDNSIASDCTN
ncbi:hypothetical protein BC833DRAFT_575781 [Globomyces pollinis-pini]|nr:hypothetical protein BC833DRAFT_575781 [Globomyces pollinis-pini]